MEKSYKVYQIKLGYLSMVNYCYLIVDEASNEAAIVDPAWDFNAIKRLLNDLKVRLTTILITHCHFDHINKVDELIEEYNPKIYISAIESDYYGYRWINMSKINDMDAIILGKTKIIALVTPGHTKGSVCYLLENSFFTGDTIFIEGCGICNTEGGSAEEMFYSIQKIREIIPRNVEVFPGHSYGKKPGYPLEYLFSNNIYFLLKEKEEFVKFRMRKNQKDLFKFQ